MKYYLILLFISNSVYYAIAQSMHSYKWNTQTVSMWHKLCHNSINNTFLLVYTMMEEKHWMRMVF